jgi:L-rhamnose isomerase / sugar isomerase
MDFQADYERLAERLAERGIDVNNVKTRLKQQHIETPSWAYMDSGTRFHVFPWSGAARTIFEKVADASYINRLTGVAPSIALHIPWDKTDDWGALVQFASEQGLTIGAINPNLFQDDEYRLGSITHPNSGIREQALAHMIECCEVMSKVGSKDLSLWFADGTNYAGQDSIRKRKHHMQEILAETYRHLPGGARMLIEYKFFEPAFYHTDLADWGMAYATALKLGERAQVLVDTGHHAQGTNIAHIVAFLLDEQRLGGFHFNARKYADDDLIVGTVNPFELFEIFTELVMASDRARDVAYMLDQNHNIEGKLQAVLISILNCQSAYAKALIVDYNTLERRQLQGDVLGAHRTLIDAYETDVRPLLAQVRVEQGLHPDPLAFFRSDDYERRIAEERR